MTVKYSGSVATNSQFAFIKLLFRWRGSIYRYIWLDLVIVFIFHIIISLIYSYFLTGPMQKNFEYYCLTCQSTLKQFPIHFVMGFFVDIVANRRWSQFQELPFPDDLAMSLAAYTHGNSEYIRKQRRTIVRYVNLSYVIAFRIMSSQVRQRFPSEFSLVQAGLATEEEIALLALVIGHYSTPIAWAQDIVIQMRKEGSIISDTDTDRLLQLLREFRSGIGTIAYYDILPIPLVYIQVATILTYCYALSLVLAWQFMGEVHPDVNIPVVGLLQFIFYMGWLKIAESLNEPFGRDDDDFDLCGFIERNLQVSYHMVDEMCDRVQPLSRGVVLDTFTNDMKASFMNHLNRVTTLNTDLFTGSILNVHLGQAHR